MTIHEYLVKAIQDDARRAGERDRLLREARRAHRAPPASSQSVALLRAIILLRERPKGWLRE